VVLLRGSGAGGGLAKGASVSLQKFGGLSPAHQSSPKTQINQTIRATKKIPMRTHVMMVSRRVRGEKRSVNRFPSKCAVFASDDTTALGNVSSYHKPRAMADGPWLISIPEKFEAASRSRAPTQAYKPALTMVSLRVGERGDPSSRLPIDRGGKDWAPSPLRQETTFSTGQPLFLFLPRSAIADALWARTSFAFGMGRQNRTSGDSAAPSQGGS